jgi:hypothetical protein
MSSTQPALETPEERAQARKRQQWHSAWTNGVMVLFGGLATLFIQWLVATLTHSLGRWWQSME